MLMDSSQTAFPSKVLVSVILDSSYHDCIPDILASLFFTGRAIGGTLSASFTVYGLDREVAEDINTSPLSIKSDTAGVHRSIPQESLPVGGSLNSRLSHLTLMDSDMDSH